jgi:hypothetical protein
MTTQTITADISDPVLQKADSDAVLEAFTAGRPVDPEVARRVHERAARVTQEMYRVHGLIDDATFQSILSDDES